MFNVRETEQLTGTPYRGIDKLRGANSIPFPETRSARARQEFSCFQGFLFLLQRQIAASWGTSFGEAAWVGRVAAENLPDNWDLAISDGIIIRERRGATFHVWLGNKAALAEHLRQSSEEAESYPWSDEAKDILRLMQEQGATQTEITSALLKIDEVRMREWYQQNRQQSLWFLELRPIFALMFESAKALGMKLPPLRDKAAWLGAGAE